MAPKSSNDNSAYKSKIKLDLEKLKNNQIQNVKMDLTKNDIKTLASQIDVLSDDVKLYMKVLTSNRYYELNHRTVHLLMKGDIDMSAVVGEEVNALSESDADVVDVIAHEREVGFL